MKILLFTLIALTCIINVFAIRPESVVLYDQILSTDTTLATGIRVEETWVNNAAMGGFKAADDFTVPSSTDYWYVDGFTVEGSYSLSTRKRAPSGALYAYVYVYKDQITAAGTHVPGDLVYFANISSTDFARKDINGLIKLSLPEPLYLASGNTFWFAFVPAMESREYFRGAIQDSQYLWKQVSTVHGNRYVYQDDSGTLGAACQSPSWSAPTECGVTTSGLDLRFRVHGISVKDTITLP